MSVQQADERGHLWFLSASDSHKNAEIAADPRITVIEFAPTDGYYWDNKHGDAVAGLKILIGAAIGKTLDDSIEGRVSL